MNNLSTLSPLKKKKKNEDSFFKSLLARILRDIFEMWPPLSGGHLHCKLGKASWCNVFVKVVTSLFLPIYTHSVYAHPIFLGHTMHYLVSRLKIFPYTCYMVYVMHIACR